MRHSRRNFIKNSLSGLIVAGSGATSLLLSGCQGTAGQRSYTAPLVKPENNSAVFHWTDIMLQAARDLRLSPLEASRGYAMAHLAGFLAIGGRPELQAFSWDGPLPVQPEVAFGIGFSRALEESWSISLAAEKRHFISRYDDTGDRHGSILVGKKAADAVIKWRTQDGAEFSRSRFYPAHYTKRLDSMAWSPTGPFYGAQSGPGFETFQRGQLPGWGAQKTWVIEDVSRYQAEPFADPQSQEFLRQYNKVRQLGSSDSKFRTAEQSEIALFWEDGPGGITPPGHFQLIGIDLVQHRSWTLQNLAEYFCVLSLAQADAGIVAWHNKYLFDILRPETAIRYAASRFPDVTALRAERQWKSYIPTPAFPSYVSGHSVFGAASARAMSLMIDSDKINLTGTPPDLVHWPKQLQGVSRTWTSLDGIAEENGVSREFGGVHWESDNLQGLNLGYDIAARVVDRAFGKT